MWFCFICISELGKERGYDTRRGGNSGCPVACSGKKDDSNVLKSSVGWDLRRKQLGQCPGTGQRSAGERRWLHSKMSNRGQTLAANNLVSPSFWRQLAFIAPSVSLLSKIQLILVYFILDKLHCVPQSWVQTSSLVIIFFKRMKSKNINFAFS